MRLFIAAGTKVNDHAAVSDGLFICEFYTFQVSASWYKLLWLKEVAAWKVLYTLENSW